MKILAILPLLLLVGCALPWTTSPGETTADADAILGLVRLTAAQLLLESPEARAQVLALPLLLEHEPPQSAENLSTVISQALVPHLEPRAALAAGQLADLAARYAKARAPDAGLVPASVAIEVAEAIRQGAEDAERVAP